MLEYRDDLFEDEETASETDENSEPNLGDFDGLLVAPSDWTISSLYGLIGKQIDLDPSFQRRSVWAEMSQSSLIESLFLNIPVPQILLASKRKDKNSFIVIDGKQRLTAIKEFMDGKRHNGKVFRLKGMRVLKQLEGKTWNEIEEEPETANLFKNATQRSIVLRGWEHDETLYEIFYRLNSGSVKLSPMELRMSLYPGQFIKHIITWTESSEALKKLLNLKNPDKRMADVELTIRHIAFSNQNAIYQGDLKKFLDETCSTYNEKISRDENFLHKVNTTLEKMETAINIAINIFGTNVCKKWDAHEQRYETRFNRAVFDIIVGSLTNQQVLDWAHQNKREFEKLFIETSNADREFVAAFETSTKNTKIVRKRFETWYNKVNEISGSELVIPQLRN
ncbi:DUF262 domain-containing protein [Kiloniella sp. b19]|uniref:DUF262 domain-containing protein n=1 Tax=Kiloniella sp. GXU_MW_B19 TaxID=3141326 RepID=UPI0031D68DCA